jgi:hypothetical protein
LQELRDSAIISTMDLETAVMPDGYTSHTVAEAAAVLSVSPSTVRAHLRQGTLPGDKIDGQWVVYLAEPADAAGDPGTRDVPGPIGALADVGRPAALVPIARRLAGALGRLGRTILRQSSGLR